MGKYFKYYYLIFISIIFFQSGIFGQSYGQIISSSKADSLFGSVITSINLPNDSLQKFIGETDNHLMFKINNDSLFVLDNNRQALHPAGITVSNEQTFTVYEIQKLIQLMNMGEKNINLVQLRKNVLTITNGLYTMEFGTICPPICD